ncbi:hypothetical protein [Kistimonas asteriae]|uniref:hypothetical protein n=1 Tax=Kistimonas asteriae TaxID=517724 RepID=UPI001BA5F7F9|nr:hypothetical protein [Kistimonas asteriae]
MLAALPSICNIKLFSNNHTVSAFGEETTSSPEANSENYIPKAPSSTLKKLKEYSIIALKIVVTIIILPIACALSIPAAFLRLIVETCKNRYKHYKKYHPGTHCINPIATYRNKKKICAELKAYCNHITPKLNKLISSESTKKMMKPLVDSIKPDTYEQLNTIKINLNERIERLHEAFFDLYKEKELREISPEENKEIEGLLDQISETYSQLEQVVSAIPEDQFESGTSENDNLLTKLFASRNRFSRYAKLYQRNIICPHCCPLCVSSVGELMPYSWRAFLFTLNTSLYFPCLSFVGAYRTAEMVLSEIWGTRKPVNYFPWHPGKAHRFPFSTSERTGIEALAPK